MEKQKDVYKFSRFTYIIEAALEYFVSIMVGTVYLAKLTEYIGISDSITGILSSFVSLGCGFQIIAIFLANKRPVKRWVTCLHIVSQSLFAALYFIPTLNISKGVKTVVFVVSLLAAQIIHNVVNAPKINWYMALVDDDKRGRFTANKEIVSLLGGMAFSYGLGAVVDYFEAAGDMRSAFIVCGIGLFVLTVLHSLTLILSKEKPVEGASQSVSVSDSVKRLIKNKDVFKIVLISVLWNVANYATTSFMGTYMVKELAFSLTFVSLISMAGSFSRVLFSRPMGKFADKYSFSKMLIICFSVEALGFAVNVFTQPSNGKIFYAIFHILNCVGFAGISSATINLLYDYVEPDQRMQALALNQTLSGTAGFLIVLILSPLVSYIQNAENTFLGIPAYAQQVLSAFSFIVTISIILYLVFVVDKIKRNKEKI